MLCSRKRILSKQVKLCRSAKFSGNRLLVPVNSQMDWVWNSQMQITRSRYPLEMITVQVSHWKKREET